MDTVTVNATSPFVCGTRTLFTYASAAESSGNLVHFYRPVWRHFKEDGYLCTLISGYVGVKAPWFLQQRLTVRYSRL